MGVMQAERFGYEESNLARLYDEAFDLALAMGRSDLVEALVESIARMLPGHLPVAAGDSAR